VSSTRKKGERREIRRGDEEKPIFPLEKKTLRKSPKGYMPWSFTIRNIKKEKATKEIVSEGGVGSDNPQQKKNERRYSKKRLLASPPESRKIVGRKYQEGGERRQPDRRTP